MTNSVKIRFTNFLNEKKATANCGSCGQNNWALPDDDSATLRLPILEKGGGITLPGPAIPVYVMFCNNCGFVRLHAVAFVDPNAMSGMQ